MWRARLLGLSHVPVHRDGSEEWRAILARSLLRVYDGFLGPARVVFLCSLSRVSLTTIS